MVEDRLRNGARTVKDRGPRASSPAAYGEAVTANHTSAGPGRILKIEVVSSAAYARGVRVEISTGAPQGFSVSESSVLRNLLPHGVPIDDDYAALRTVSQAIQDVRIQFIAGGIGCGFDGAEALAAFCTATGHRALPASLTDLTCPSTGLQLNSLKDFHQLQELADNPKFNRGAYVLLADANRLSVLNHTESRGDVSKGLKIFAQELRKLLADLPTLVNRMGDEIIVAIPAVDAERLRPQLVAHFKSPIHQIRPFTAEMCAMRDAVETIETRFLATRNGVSDTRSFFSHLKAELLSVQERFGQQPDDSGAVSGTIPRVLRLLNAWESQLLSSPRSLDLAEVQIRVAGFLVDLLMRSQRRFGKFSGTAPFLPGPTKPGAFDLAAVYLTQDELRSPATVELAVHACSKFVGRKKRQVPNQVPLFSRSHGWEVIERTNAERKAILRFNKRVENYASLRAQVMQLRESRLLDRFAISAQLTASLFGHPFIEGVYQLRALATERPVEVAGIDPDVPHQILTLELNLKPFNDLGYDLGDRVMAEIASVVNRRIPGAMLCIEGGELSVLLRGAGDVSDSFISELATEAREAVKGLMENALFSARSGSQWLQADGDARRNNFHRRGIYSLTWKRLLRRMRGFIQDRRETDLYKVRISKRQVDIDPRATFKDVFNLE